MMGKQIVRPAHSEDAKALAKVKSRYVQSLYRGVLSANYLKSLDDVCFLDQVNGWLTDERQVDVLENHGTVTAFIVYGDDPENEHCALIHEVGILPMGSWQEKDVLMRSCLDKLAQQYELVRVHTVRDNFRARYLFEQYGFRPDGAEFLAKIDGNELKVIRLVARIGRNQ